MKWIEESGVDILGKSVRHSSFNVEVVEYLLRKGLRASDIDFRLQYDVMKVFVRLNLIDELKRVDISLLPLDFLSVKLLLSVGYEFNKGDALEAVSKRDPKDYVGLLCCGVLKKQHLSASQVSKVGHHVLRDVKVCVPMFPFMKSTRQTKIMTVLHVFKHTLIPKQIVWMILDFCFSPIQERGINVT